MRWPIRNQILFPFLLLQVVAVVALTAAAAWIAVRQAERGVSGRLTRVSSALETSNYPLTPAILEQLSQLSGAELAVFDDEQRLSAATFNEHPSLAAILQTSGRQRNNARLLDDRSLITIGQERFFAGVVHRDLGEASATLLVLYPEQNWEQARQQAMYPPLAIGLVCLGLTIAMSIVLSRMIGGRIQSAQSHVVRIASGDFAPVPLGIIDDELRDLSAGVNRMAAALEASLRSIREQERSKLLTQLVGGLAHQLRNALTGARMSVQLHRRHCPRSHDESLDVALKQLTLTEEQIKSLLRLSRGESRPPAPGSMAGIVNEVAALLAPVCAHQKIGFEVRLDKCEVPVDDADAQRGAILNLGMNAIEAAGPGGAVGIDARFDLQEGVIEVTDNGPGIPEHRRHEVFTPFFSTKREGAGLGLALARRAAEDCGGTLTMSCGQGRTTFRLTIRVCAGAQAVTDETSSRSTGNADSRLAAAPLD